MSAGTVKRAWAAYHKGEMQQASELFAKAHQSHPDAALPLIQNGLFLLKQDRFAEAAASLSQAITVEPKNPAPLFFLCVAYELGDEHPKAKETLERLTELCPRHQGLASVKLLMALRQGDPAPMLAQLGFGPKAEKRSEGGWRSLLAGVGAGDPDWLCPDLSSSDYLMGPIMLEVERRLVPLEIPQLERRSRDLMEQLDAFKPAKRDWRAEMKGFRRSLAGGSYLKKGKQLLEKALSIPSVLEQREQLHKAAVQLRLARKLDAMAFRTSYYLGEAYLFAAKDEPGKPYRRFPLVQAERAFLESARLDGINPYILFYLALCQHLLGRPETAITVYKKATDSFEKLPEAHYGSGQCHLLLGDTLKARELILKAVNSDLALGRERITLLATLLEELGQEALEKPLPKQPPPLESQELEPEKPEPQESQPAVESLETDTEKDDSPPAG